MDLNLVEFYLYEYFTHKHTLKNSFVNLYRGKFKLNKFKIFLLLLFLYIVSFCYFLSVQIMFFVFGFFFLSQCFKEFFDTLIF